MGTRGGGSGDVVISDGPGFDFGYVDVGQLGEHTFDVTNEGTSDARNLTSMAPEPPFGWAGGSFPGSGGTCTDTLPAGETCTVAVAFEPAEWGPFESHFELHYDGGSAARAVEGGGADRSRNLLANGGAEQCPNFGAPDGWMDLDAGGWTCWDGQTRRGSWIDPVAGEWFFDAGQVWEGGVFRLGQDVDLTEFGDLFAEGFLRLEFSGWGRSSDLGDDDFAIGFRFFSGEERIEDASYDSEWMTSGDWMELREEGVPPEGADTMRVLLMCEKPNMGMFCDAFFDELTLHAVHP